MITEPCCFSQAVLHNCLNSYLVMSLLTWSLKMWLRFFNSSSLGETGKWISHSLWLFDVAAWNNFELNRNNQHCCVFLWHNTIHRCFVFQITNHQIQLVSFSLNLVLLGREHLQPINKNLHTTSDLSLISFAISSTIDMREIPKSVISFWFSNNLIVTCLGIFSSKAFSRIWYSGWNILLPKIFMLL